MGAQSNNKRIAKNTMFLYFRMIVIMVIRLYSSRVLLDELGVDDYGLYNVIGGMVVMFSFINNAMTDSTQRFLTFELGKSNFKQLAVVFRTSIYIHCVVAVVLFCLLECFGCWFVYNKMNIPDGRTSACLCVMHLSILTTALKIVVVPNNALIIAHEKMKIFAGISIMEAFLLLLSLLSLSLFNHDKLILYGGFVLAVQLIVSAVYYMYCLNNFQETRHKEAVNKSTFVEMLKFASWNMCGNMAQLFSTHGLNMMLNVFFSPAVNAARGVAVVVQGAVGQFVGSFQSALNPQITKSYATNDKLRLKGLIFFSSKITFFLLLIVTLPLYLEADFVLNVWLKEVPQLSVVFFRLIVFVTIVEAIINPINVAVAATGKIKVYQLVNGGVTLLVLPVSYLFFMNGFPPVTAFLIQVVLCVLSSIFRLLIAKFLLDLDIDGYVWEVCTKCIMVAILSIVVPYYVLTIIDSSWIRFVIVICLSLLSSLMFMFGVGINGHERKMIKSVLISKISNILNLR